MLRCFTKNWLLGVAALAAGSPVSAQENAWQQPEHLRGSNVRIFQSDGTPPAASKGPVPKPKVVEQPPPVAKVVDKAKREADLTPAVVQPVVHVSPVVRLTSLPWPKMPHGYQDPTHPVGPAEPGSAAAVRFGPASSGYTLPRR